MLSIYEHEIWLHRKSMVKGYEDPQFARSITVCVDAAHGLLDTIKEAERVKYPGYNVCLSACEAPSSGS